VLERYEFDFDHEIGSSECTLTQCLRDFPDSPRDYLSTHDEINSRWSFLTRIYTEEGSLQQWRPSFYTLPAHPSKAFHLLCDFYSAYIRAECRMMIEASESLKESAEIQMSTLRYELLTLRDELLELIRESSSRTGKDWPGTLPGNLNRYVLPLLQNSLLMTLLELQTRSEHLFERRVIPERELYLIYLGRSIPDERDWHRTPALTRFELELTLRTQNPAEQLASVEALLATVRKEVPVEQSDRIQDSINLLENVWFCLFIKSKTDRWDNIDLNRPEECASAITDIQQRLFDYSVEDEDSNDRQILKAVIQHIATIRSSIQQSGKLEGSAAARLVASIDDYYSQNSSLNGGSSIQRDSISAAAVQESSRASILDDYILVDELKEKLDVTQKSLNSYISDSKTPVLKFSNKTKLIHINDLKAMMDHFKTDL
jgi:hypothetical protein